MVQRELTVALNSGLHSKSAAEFIQKASSYKSSVWIEKDSKRANAKSLLGLMALEIYGSSAVTLIADGEDEGAAVDELREYLISGASD